MAERATFVARESPIDRARPRIYVLSDSDRLYRLISYLLADYGPVAGWVSKGEAETSPTFALHASQLVIIAAAATTSEPLVMLAQAGLAAFVGRVPLLLITDRPFLAPPDNSIYHLNYPFAPEALLKIVGELCPV